MIRNLAGLHHTKRTLVHREKIIYCNANDARPLGGLLLCPCTKNKRAVAGAVVRPDVTTNRRSDIRTRTGKRAEHTEECLLIDPLLQPFDNRPRKLLAHHRRNCRGNRLPRIRSNECFQLRSPRRRERDALIKHRAPFLRGLLGQKKGTPFAKRRDWIRFTNHQRARRLRLGRLGGLKRDERSSPHRTRFVPTGKPQRGKDRHKGSQKRGYSNRFRHVRALNSRRFHARGGGNLFDFEMSATGISHFRPHRREKSFSTTLKVLPNRHK